MIRERVANQRARQKVWMSLLTCALPVLILVGAYAADLQEMDGFKVVAATMVGMLSIFLFVYCRIFLVAALFGLLPFTRGVLQFEIGVITFSPFTFGLVAMTAACFVAALVSKNSRFRFTTIDTLLLVLGVYFFVSTVLSSDITLVGLVAFHGLFIPICVYFLLCLNVRSTFDRNLVFTGLFVGATIFALIHIYTVLTSNARVDVLGVPSISIASLMVLPVLGILLGAMYGRYKGKVLALPVLLSYLMSFSRMYLAGLLFSPVIYWFCRKGRGSILISIFMVVTLILTIAFTYSADSSRSEFLGQKVATGRLERDEIRETERSSSRLTDSSHLIYALYGRALAQQYGFEQFIESPVFGTGISPREAGLATQHNFHVEWLQYGGLVGYMLYSAIVILFFRRTDQTAKSDRFVAVVQTTIVLVLFNSFTNGLMHGLMPVVLFMLMGLARAIQERSAARRV